jgi:hypothetical protein
LKLADLSLSMLGRLDLRPEAFFVLFIGASSVFQKPMVFELICKLRRPLLLQSLAAIRLKWGFGTAAIVLEVSETGCREEAGEFAVLQLSCSR